MKENLKLVCSRCHKPLGKHNGLNDYPLPGGLGFNYGVKFKKSRPLNTKEVAKPAHNTRKLFTGAHAAFHKWEKRHEEVTASEVCFIAGAKWAARQLA